MIRNADLKDVPYIINIIKNIIKEMNSYGNYQWDENYPNEKDFISDINKKNLYVYEYEKKLIGFICINTDQPKEYKDLNWLVKDKCMVIHRMGVNTLFRRKGIGKKLMEFTEKLALENNIDYLKLDTCSVNKKMLGLFQKCGFKFVDKFKFISKKEYFYAYEKKL